MLVAALPSAGIALSFDAEYDRRGSSLKFDEGGEMSRLPWMLAVAALFAAVSAGGSSTATYSGSSSAVKFAITRTDIPVFIKQNGPRGTRTIYWEGNPVFPVTVNERGICPEDVNCGPRDASGWGKGVGKTVFATKKDPLVTPNYYYCNGSFSSNYVIGVEYWLTDAKGQRTAIVRDFWVCKTH